jgi:hypothetical protein
LIFRNIASASAYQAERPLSARRQDGRTQSWRAHVRRARHGKLERQKPLSFQIAGRRQQFRSAGELIPAPASPLPGADSSRYTSGESEAKWLSKVRAFLRHLSSFVQTDSGCVTSTF